MHPESHACHAKPAPDTPSETLAADPNGASPANTNGPSRTRSAARDNAPRTRSHPQTPTWKEEPFAMHSGEETFLLWFLLFLLLLLRYELALGLRRFWSRSTPQAAKTLALHESKEFAVGYELISNS